MTVYIVYCTGKPDRPENLKLTATAVSLTIEWDRGFNGGLLQTFHLGYGGSQQPIQDDNPVENDHYTVRLGDGEGIRESTDYTVSLYAANMLGDSSTLRETIRTKGRLN